MIITEVRIKLMDEQGERLRAFCSITFDDAFVVRDLKIIEGASGLFVAMPSRKLTAHCGKCGMKNHLRANHCNQCGARLGEGRVIKDADGRTKLYADIAHPINSTCREMIQSRVVEEYNKELELAKSPNYVSRYDEYDAGDFHDTDDTPAPIRRIDSAHEKTSSNKPHHPPQGDPSRTSTGKPHIAPTDTSSSAYLEKGAGERDLNGRNEAGGFGAGIF
ncbi:Putative septation protein SpoVG [Planctomycetes bacterium MalM25]|nr:Putative septation protein SpoVG [Planctomycetes bacterium MalM25]